MRSFLKQRFAVAMACLMIGVFGHIAGRAQAVIIDDFTVGPITVVGPDIQTQTDLDPDHVLGGSRMINVGRFGSGSVLEVDPDIGLKFHSTDWGYFTMRYDLSSSGGGTDLTPGGHDRFRLEFGEISTATFTPLAMYVTLPPNLSSNGISLYLGNWDGLILEFPYDRFPAAMTDVQNITLDVFRNRGGASLELKTIMTVGPPLPGDYNRDGRVDADDYVVWSRFTGIRTRNGALGGAVASADGNSDGYVDAADYVIWRKHGGAGTSTAAATGVPEPNTLMLVIAAALVRAARSRVHRRRT